MALKKSDSSGNGHYMLYHIEHARIFLLIRHIPKQLQEARGVGNFAKIVLSMSNKSTWWITLIKHVANCSKKQNMRPSATTLYKCSLCCWGCYCLHPLHIAGRLRWGQYIPGEWTSHVCKMRLMATKMDKRSLIIQMVTNHHMEKYKELLSETNEEKEKNEENEVVTEIHWRWAPAAENLPLTILAEMEKVFLRLGFSQMEAKKLMKDPLW